MHIPTQDYLRKPLTWCVIYPEMFFPREYNKMQCNKKKCCPGMIHNETFRDVHVFKLETFKRWKNWQISCFAVKLQEFTPWEFTPWEFTPWEIKHEKLQHERLHLENLHHENSHFSQFLKKLIIIAKPAG